MRVTSTGTRGFCTQECGFDNPCPSDPPGAACNLANEDATGSLCSWPCDGAGDTCPAGLTCTEVPAAGASWCQ